MSNDNGKRGPSPNIPNPFYREYPDHLDTGAVADLPDMQGSGLVRDLREAATLSTGLATELRALQSQGYVGRDQYLAQIKRIIDAWADTSSLKDWQARQELAQAGEAYDGPKTSVGTHYIEGTGVGVGATAGCTVNIIYQPSGVDRTLLEREVGASTVGTGGGGTGGTALGTPLNLSEEARAAQLAKWQRATYLIETLERYNGLTFIDILPDRVSSVAGRFGKVSRGGTPGNGAWRRAA